MAMELKTARGRLLLFLALIISLPILNYNFKFIESGKLDGVSPKPEFAPFSLKSWWDGSFQQQRNTLMNDSIGFRPDLVRMNNQIDYWLFGKINASTIILGSDDYLFGRMYIDEYNGISYMGDTTIIKVCVKIKKIQDTMDKLGKTFMMVYTPSKAYYFADKIPSYLQRKGPRQTNYYSFRHFGDSMHIRQLDYNALFPLMRDTSRHPLISKQGIHWSVYGAVVAADTMIKRMEYERKIHIPHLRIINLVQPDTIRSPDNDLAVILNMIVPMTKEKLVYPDIEYIDTAGATKPRIIYVGDSFMWLWISTGVLQGMNRDWEFWPHFHEVWNNKAISGQEERKEMKDYDWKKALNESDGVMLMFNPINLYGFTEQSQFVENVYNYYYPAKQGNRVAP